MGLVWGDCMGPPFCSEVRDSLVELNRTVGPAARRPPIAPPVLMGAATWFNSPDLTTYMGCPWLEQIISRRKETPHSASRVSQSGIPRLALSQSIVLNLARDASSLILPTQT